MLWETAWLFAHRSVSGERERERERRKRPFLAADLREAAAAGFEFPKAAARINDSEQAV
jgi:hypothetical protein